MLSHTAQLCYPHSAAPFFSSVRRSVFLAPTLRLYTAGSIVLQNYAHSAGMVEAVYLAHKPKGHIHTG